jgi:hypothetical protein
VNPALSALKAFGHGHLRNATCRRQIEKSPLAQTEMLLSTVLVGEFWADDGDRDEPDGDRPDERVAGSGCEQIVTSLNGGDTTSFG